MAHVVRLSKKEIAIRSARLSEIKEHPELHHHGSLAGIIQCSMSNGTVDLSIFDAHQEYASLGRNGGRNCDVTRGSVFMWSVALVQTFSRIAAETVRKPEILCGIASLLYF